MNPVADWASRIGKPADPGWFDTVDSTPGMLQGKAVDPRYGALRIVVDGGVVIRIEVELPTPVPVQALGLGPAEPVYAADAVHPTLFWWLESLSIAADLAPSGVVRLVLAGR